MCLVYKYIKKYMENIIKNLDKYDSIYIYGAGYVGGLLKDYLANKGIEINGFCVSKVTESDNILAKQISCIDINAFIFLAVTGRHRDEMKKNMISLGFKNYHVLSDTEIVFLQREADLKKKLRFQVHVAEHCNLNCRGCYHFSSLAKEEYLSVDEYYEDVKRLSYLFHGEVEEAMLLGGEPLLHPRISEFLKITRECFPTGNVCILSNGILLNKMDETFYKYIRQYDIELRVTKYPINIDYDGIEKQLSDKWGINLHYFNKEPIRSLGHQPLDITGSRDYKKNFYSCYRANQCVDLKHGRLYPCIIPAEIKPFSEYFGLDIHPSYDDSVDIYDVSSGEELLERLAEPIPFCRYCNRDDVQVFGRIPWDITSHNIKEWTE